MDGDPKGDICWEWENLRLRHEFHAKAVEKLIEHLCMTRLISYAEHCEQERQANQSESPLTGLVRPLVVKTESAGFEHSCIESDIAVKKLF